MTFSSLPHLRLVVACLSLAFLAGCTGGPRVANLGVSLVGVKGADASLLETRLVATVRIINENVVPVAFAGAKHKLYLNGTYVGQALTKEPLGLQQLSTATQDVTFMLENTALVAKVRAMADAAQVSYRLESVLYIVAGDEKLESKTSGSGSLDLRALTAP